MPHRCATVAKPRQQPIEYESFDKDLVFVVSGGRTGTAFLGDRLDLAIPSATSYHEPDLLDGFSWRSWKAIRRFGFYHMVVGRLLGITGVRVLTQDYLSGRIDHDDAITAVLRQRLPFYQAQSSPLVVEAYYQWFGLLPVVRDAFPEAKVVGIVRDPRSWVASWLRFGGHHDKNDKVRSLGMSRLNPAMVGDKAYEHEWHQMGAFERLCWDWRTIYDLIQRFTTTDQLCRLYRFEDIFAPNGRMPELLSWMTSFEQRSYDFASLDNLLRDRINASSNEKRPDWLGWSPEMAATLQEICAPLMTDFGYGLESEWRDLLDRDRD